MQSDAECAEAVQQASNELPSFFGGYVEGDEKMPVPLGGSLKTKLLAVFLAALISRRTVRICAFRLVSWLLCFSFVVSFVVVAFMKTENTFQCSGPGALLLLPPHARRSLPLFRCPLFRCLNCHVRAHVSCTVLFTFLRWSTGAPFDLVGCFLSFSSYRQRSTSDPRRMPFQGEGGSCRHRTPPDRAKLSYEQHWPKIHNL